MTALIRADDLYINLEVEGHDYDWRDVRAETGLDVQEALTLATDLLRAAYVLDPAATRNRMLAELAVGLAQEGRA